jgi:RNA polymerase sigma-70 factor, ECF subfamily
MQVNATFLTAHTTNIQMMRITDRIVVEAFLLTRDEAAFRWIYRQYGEVLWRFALRLTGGDQSASADIVQDTWVRAIDKLSTFRWQSSLKTWLMGIVLYRSKEYWRSQMTAQLRFSPFETAIFELTDEGFGPDKMDLETAFAHLPPGYRAVLTLHDVEGFRHEEIAELLQISVGTSKSQLSRGRAFLRRFFDENI